MTTIHSFITHLQKTSSVEPREVELIMAHVINKSREFVIAHPGQEIMQNEKCKIKSHIKRREEGEPLAYILGHKEFFGYDFIVTPDTLIPRPETEILVEEILKFLKQRENPLCRSADISPFAGGDNNEEEHLKPLCSPRRAGHSPTSRQISPLAGEDYLPLPPLPRGGDESASRRGFTLFDIGTGSGCIITSIVKQLKNFQFPISNFQFFGVDLSEKALEVAKQNAKNHHAEKDITFLHSNLLEIFLSSPSLLPCHLSPVTCNQVIVANLPYVPTPYLKEKKTHLTKGLAFEPNLALDGGNDGFDAYRTLLAQIKQLHTAYPASVQCFFEIGSDQQEIAKKEIQKVFPNAEPIFTNDLSEQVRVVSFCLPKIST